MERLRCGVLYAQGQLRRYYQNFFSSRPYGCKMYLAVEQLLETLGEPSNSMISKFS